jgi:FkbM family methyltransferase
MNMGFGSVIRRVGNIASSSLNTFLWKTLRPAMNSATGIPITLSSRSDWDAFSEIWVSGEYDQAITEAFRAVQDTRPVRVVDLGANVGLFSLRCIEVRNRLFPGLAIDITAVEGVARTFAILSRNLAPQRNDETRLSARHGLVGERSGTGQIYDHAYAGANSVVPAGGKVSVLGFRAAHAVTSQYIDLESLLPPDLPLDLIKCDIEGSEGAFLRNYGNLVARARQLIIELHPRHCDAEECRQVLAAAGLRREQTLRTSPETVLETWAACAEQPR